MIQVPYSLDLISRKKAKLLLLEATENYMRKIVEFREMDGSILAFEKRFEANGYTYKEPMTNDEFKEMARKQIGEKSNDPMSLNTLAEQLKTGYTNHFMEYMNKKKAVENMETILGKYEEQIRFLKNRKRSRLGQLLNIFGI